MKATREKRKMRKNTLFSGFVVVLLIVFTFGCTKEKGDELSDKELEGIGEELQEDKIDESADSEVDSDLEELNEDGEELEEIEQDDFDAGFSEDEDFGEEESLDEDIDQGLDF